MKTLYFILSVLFLAACATAQPQSPASNQVAVPTVVPTVETTKVPCAFEAYTVGGDIDQDGDGISDPYLSIEVAPPVTFNVISSTNVEIIFVTEGFQTSVNHDQTIGGCAHTWFYVPQLADGRVTVGFIEVKSRTVSGQERTHLIPTDLISVVSP